jgi:putative membrane protein
MKPIALIVRGVVLAAEPSASTRARDHLANERTYLAWLRTGAAVMAIGLAIAGLGNSTTGASIAAATVLVVAGAAGVGYGTVHYRRLGDQIESDRFDVRDRGRAGVVASTVLVVAVVVALIVLLVSRH